MFALNFSRWIRLLYVFGIRDECVSVVMSHLSGKRGWHSIYSDFLDREKTEVILGNFHITIFGQPYKWCPSVFDRFFNLKYIKKEYHANTYQSRVGTHLLLASGRTRNAKRNAQECLNKELKMFKFI